MLSDPIIRTALLKKLRNARPQARAIMEELRIHNGNAIADVVAIHSEAHCYEIKGDSDKVERITEQGKYYDLAFRKVTLVTTSRHIKKAINISPPHWGIIEAKTNPHGNVIFKSIRPAKTNKKFDKKTALLTLWRNELFEIASKTQEKIGAKTNRNSLSLLIADCYGTQELSLTISEALTLRSVTKH